MKTIKRNQTPDFLTIFSPRIFSSVSWLHLLPSYNSVFPISSSCRFPPSHPQLHTVHHRGRSSLIGRTARGTTVPSACHWRTLGTRGTLSVSVCIWPNNAILVHSCCSLFTVHPNDVISSQCCAIINLTYSLWLCRCMNCYSYLWC